jgi:hypothetical protein
MIENVKMVSLRAKAKSRRVLFSPGLKEISKKHKGLERFSHTTRKQ